MCSEHCREGLPQEPPGPELYFMMLLRAGVLQQKIWVRVAFTIMGNFIGAMIPTEYVYQ
jgi:hypothetical protein